MNLILIVFAAFAAFVTPSTSDAEGITARVKYLPKQYLKNFALSNCIAGGYESQEVVKDSLAAAGGYLELGSYPYEAYEEAAALSKQFLANDYKAKTGEKLTLMKCIDFFHSEELEQIAKKYSK